jgi:hypothetical protein
LHDFYRQLLSAVCQDYFVILAQRIETKCRRSEGQLGVLKTSDCKLDETLNRIFDLFIDKSLAALVNT